MSKNLDIIGMEVTAPKQVDPTVSPSTMIARFWIVGKVGCHMGDVERIGWQDVFRIEKLTGV
jgi:hypothetical protein